MFERRRVLVHRPTTPAQPKLNEHREKKQFVAVQQRLNYRKLISEAGNLKRLCETINFALVLLAMKITIAESRNV